MIQERDYYVDVNISGVTMDNMTAAIKTSGAIAESGEKRKLQEVRRTFVVEDESSIVPFVMEMTGALGPRANAFLRSIISTAQLPANEVPSGEEEVQSGVPTHGDVDRSALGVYRARLLWSARERLSAAVHRRNAGILQLYTRKVTAQPQT